MRKYLLHVLIISFVFLLVPIVFIVSPVFAVDRERPVAGRFYLSPEGGTSFTIGGEFINRMKFDASLNLADVSITATLSNDKFDFDDVFKTPKVFGLSLG